MPKYSIIIPVFNRPDELEELLESLTRQQPGAPLPSPTDSGSGGPAPSAPASAEPSSFEVVVVEDGSSVPADDVCRRYASRLAIRYYAKPNGGPGPARNFGAERATGEWLIVLDSDVILPPAYLAAIDAELSSSPADAFGGPDRAHPDFTPTQKAINYAMTSFFTTGGIRGGKKQLDRFFPRSFNMGVEAGLWRRLGGFRPMRFGEDIDFSYRIVESGARCRLFPHAWVWHKRRTDFAKFFRQVRNSGAARINLHLLHPGTMKLVHMLPAAFTVGVATLAATILAGIGFVAAGAWATASAASTAANMGPTFVRLGSALAALGLAPLLLYAIIIFADAARTERSLRVGLLAVPAAFIQLTGYGTGFITAAWQRLVLRRRDEGFDDNATLYK